MIALLRLKLTNTDNAEVVINHTLASAYVKALKELSKEYDLRADFGTVSVSHFPDVFVLKENGRGRGKTLE